MVLNKTAQMNPTVLFQHKTLNMSGSAHVLLMLLDTWVRTVFCVLRLSCKLREALCRLLERAGRNIEEVGEKRSGPFTAVGTIYAHRTARRWA